MENNEGTVPEPQRPMGGFAVYSTEALEEEIDTEAVQAPGVPGEETPDYGERYIEPEDIPVTHNVRMRPGSSLSIGRRNVYRTDRRGVPHFAAGWVPAHARVHYRRTWITAAAIACASVAGSVAMALAGVGTNSEYMSLASEDNLVSGTVTGVRRTTEADPDKHAMFRTDEITSFSYQSGGTQSGTVTDSTTDTVPPLAADTKWQQGQKVDLYVDPEDPSHFIPEDPEEPGRINAITLLPLFPAALAAGSAVVAGRKTGLMKQLENAA